MRAILSWLRRSASAERDPLDEFLLNQQRFELAAAAERMRVDRNGSVLSLLVLRLAPSRCGADDVRALAARMATRLRITDTVGRLADGRIGVLLPDTPEAGAWKVASDLCEAYPAGAERPDCDVQVYPEEPPAPRRPHGSANAGEGQATDGAMSPPTGRVHATRFDELLVRPTPAWKRSIDIGGAVVGMVLAAPVVLVAAAAIRLTSPGPAIFRQRRAGLGGKPFRMWKLRTMYVDAERRKSELLESSDQDGPAFKMEQDPRVTRVGAFLRRTSIDELPQLLNVLMGDMSLVGPRPLPTEESLACLPWHHRRLHVAPGITCIWQVRGRNTVSFDDWVRMDLDYAENRSPWLDAKLLLQTGPSLVTQPGR